MHLVVEDADKYYFAPTFGRKRQIFALFFGFALFFWKKITDFCPVFWINNLTILVRKPLYF